MEKVIRDSVHGDIELSPEEIRIIRTPTLREDDQSAGAVPCKVAA
jgi:hypothetical protein